MLVVGLLDQQKLQQTQFEKFLVFKQSIMLFKYFCHSLALNLTLTAIYGQLDNIIGHNTPFLTNKAKRSLNFKKLTKQKMLGSHSFIALNLTLIAIQGQLDNIIGHNHPTTHPTPPTHPPHTRSFLTNKAKRSLNFKKLTKQNMLGYIRRV